MAKILPFQMENVFHMIEKTASNLTLTPAEAAFWTKAQSLVLLNAL